MISRAIASVAGWYLRRATIDACARCLGIRRMPFERSASLESRINARVVQLAASMEWRR